MTPVFYDLETFYSVEHSLTKMNPIVYIMHPETELQSVSIAIGDGEAKTYLGPGDAAAALLAIDWSDKIAVAHNGAGFDHLFLAWRLGIRPKKWACTQAMARPFYGLTCGVGLKAVSEAMGLPPKGSLEEVNTKGLKFAQFTDDMKQRMILYNDRDTLNCREIFNRLLPRLGMTEMRLIDTMIRMTVEPHFLADVGLLQQALAEEKEKKRQALIRLAHHCLPSATVDSFGTEDDLLAAMRSIVMSQAQFAGLLRDLGVEVPLKPSKTAKDEHGRPKMIPALAKTDAGMTALLEYEDPDGDEERQLSVQVAAAARLEVKTTQLETRLQTYISVSRACNGYLPMPVNYCGATISWRMSGAMKMNVQNPPRIPRDKNKQIVHQTSNALRLGLVAPPGHVVVVADSSNIELRVAHTLAGQEDTVEKLRNKEDLYCWFASNLYGRTITKKDEDERFIGKVAMLSLQYGASWRSFQNMARILSKGKVLLDDYTCQETVATWRGMFGAIAGPAGIWKRCDAALTALHRRMTYRIDDSGLVVVENGQIATPQNHWLQYPSLHKERNQETGRDEWIYGTGRNRSRIYGSHLFENICQHLARIIVMEQTLAASKYYPVALSCHDEAVFVVPEEQSETCKRDVLKIMSTSPTWWPEIPVAAEAGIGRTYGEAK